VYIRGLGWTASIFMAAVASLSSDPLREPLIPQPPAGSGALAHYPLELGRTGEIPQGIP
jgi:hypothetical protein